MGNHGLILLGVLIAGGKLCRVEQSVYVFSNLTTKDRFPCETVFVVTVGLPGRKTIFYEYPD